jgi:hypothetical protein
VATIALYANKIIQMPGLIRDIKKSVTDYKSELSALKTKSLAINKSVCNLDDVISSIQASSQTQERKIALLETFSNNCEQFITDTIGIDREVADIVKKRKDDFYDKNSYLKPECEKDKLEIWLENRWNDLKTADEWCKEHWKLVVTVAIVVAAVVLILTGVGGILGAMALGALFGTVIGGTIGGVLSVRQGGSFFEGVENGAFNGAIAGIITGGMGFAMSAGGTVALSLKQTLLIGGVSGAGTSLISDLGDKFIKGDNISWGQIGLNLLVSGTVGVAFAGIGYGISKSLGALFKNVSWFSKAKELFRIGKTSNANYGRITSYTTSKPQGVSLNFANGTGKSIFRIEFDVSKYLHYHLPSLFGTKAHVPFSPILDSSIATNISNYIKEIIGGR